MASSPSGSREGLAVATGLVFYAVLGVVSTAAAFIYNKRLFVGSRSGRVSLLEGVFYFIGLLSLALGWYFNIRYVQQFGHKATYVSYTKSLFSSWSADSAGQDYTIVNLLLLPLWTIVDGRRRGMRIPWIFFVMSLFTSLAFSMAMYLAFVERQIRYNEGEPIESKMAYPQL